MLLPRTRASTISPLDTPSRSEISLSLFIVSGSRRRVIVCLLSSDAFLPAPGLDPPLVVIQLSRIKLNNLSISVHNLFIEVVGLIVAILIVLNRLGFSFFVKSELHLSMGVELAGH